MTGVRRGGRRTGVSTRSGGGGGAIMTTTSLKSHNPNKSSSSPSISDDVPGGAAPPVEENNVYWLKWNTKSDHFSAELSKLFGSGENLMGLTDVTLVSADGHLVQAHKLVLSMCSPFFRRVFLQASRAAADKSNTTVVVLANIRLQYLRYLLQFFYDGEVDVPAAQLDEFLRIGEMLRIEGLSGYIKTFVRAAAGKNVGGGQYQGSSSSSAQWYQDDKEDDTDTPYSRVTTAPAVTLLESYSLNSEEPGGDEPGANSPIPIDDEGSVDDLGDDDDDNDQCSNFSDEIGSSSRVRRSRDKKFNNNSNSQLGRESHHGADQGEPEEALDNFEWFEIEPLSDLELRNNWRVSKTKKNHKTSDRVVRTFYCAHTKNSANPECPARLRQETSGGATTFFSNNLEHGNHREKAFGLSAQQKDFVLKMMDLGVSAEREIVKAMESEGVPFPLKNQVTGFIKKYRAKNGLTAPGKPKAKKKFLPRSTAGSASKSKKVKAEPQLQQAYAVKSSSGPPDATITTTTTKREPEVTRISTDLVPGGGGGGGPRPCSSGTSLHHHVPTTAAHLYQHHHHHQMQHGHHHPRPPVVANSGNNNPTTTTTIDFSQFGYFNL